MRRPSNLELRGAVDILSRALMHVGRNYIVNDKRWCNYAVDEWGTGQYLDPARQAASEFLDFAVWRVKKELEKC